MDLIDLGQSKKGVEVEKNHIFVIFEDKESRVSWYVDTSLEDTRFAIICACDALVDAEFEVLDDKAKVVDLDKIKAFKNGTVFFLRKKVSGKPTNIMLDSKRKLFVEIEPLRHIESQVAVKYMIIGSNLLKHTKKGLPHIRFFQLSSDFKRILWYTKSKNIDEANVPLDSIEEISIGQISETFIRYPLKMLENFSFSLYYIKKGNKLATLDITCKDEREFDLWVIGIKALRAHFSTSIINKNELLSHSSSYKDQIEKGNIGSCTRYLIYNNISTETKHTKSLEKFIVSRNMTHFDIAKLFEKLSFKLKSTRDEVEVLSQVDNYNTGSQEKGYDMIFAEEAIVDDLDTQKNQMIVLYKDSEKNLSILLQQFLWFTKEHKMKSLYNIHEDDMDDFTKTIEKLDNYQETNLTSFDDFNTQSINVDFFLKELDIQLWKIEIDLENVGDIINRFKTPFNTTILDSIKNFFSFFKK